MTSSDLSRGARKASSVTWRRFSHKAYAAFLSLHREVRIGVLAVAMLSACTFVRQPASTSVGLQRGDLLFCLETSDDDAGLGSAIAAVNSGIGQFGVSHVAIVAEAGGADPASLSILEATPQAGVRLTSLSRFLDEAHHAADGSPLVLAGRLRDTTGVASSLRRALTFVGLPYDTLYLPDNPAIYCSELVQLAYRRPGGQPIFPPQPMSFRDSSGTLLPYWIELYRSHGMEVPEGLPGSHPATLSRDTSLVIFNLPNYQ